MKTIVSKTKLLSLIITLSVLVSFLSGCTKEAHYYTYFDTVSTVASYARESNKKFDKRCDFISSELERYHKLFDIYYEYSGINNLKTVNNNAGVRPVEVDRDIIELILYCKELYTLTGGRLNVAMGGVLKLWHEARSNAADNPEAAQIPSRDALAEAAKHADIDSIVVDEAAGTVYISDPLTSIDVGAIAKGYATERIAEALNEQGVSSYVLNVGGNIRAIGTKPNGDGWTTGITNPDKSGSEPFVCRVTLNGGSLVTSGDYERFFTVNGVSYHHIIDPATLMPAAYFSSVSVFTEDSGLADALSTALFCASYEDGLSLIESIGSVDVIWVTRDGEVIMTDGVRVIQ